MTHPAPRTRQIAASQCKGLVVRVTIEPEPPAWVTVTTVRTMGRDFVRVAFLHPTLGHTFIECHRSRQLPLQVGQTRPGEAKPPPPPEPGLF